MDWEATRADFPILARRTYLNSCSLGALSRQTRGAVNNFLDLWEEHGASAWYEIWMGELQATRERFARLINASPDEVALLPNVSSALSVLASASPSTPQTNVVCAAMDFPTLTYQWQAKPGVDVRLAPTSDGVTTPFEGYQKLVDSNTQWLATSHILYTSGAINDAKALGKLAHSNGALFLLDAYQATGQLPTDVKALGVDAYVTGGLKWLLGGPGISFVYVRKELHERLSPTATGWFAHKEQFKFDTAGFTPRDDARRFETGTPALPSVYAGNAGLGIIEKLGPQAIRQRTAELGRDLYERLQDAGYELATPRKEDERAGIIMVRDPEHAKTVASLRSRFDIVVDHRPGRVRVSPYFYNTFEENEKFVDAIREVSPPRS